MLASESFYFAITLDLLLNLFLSPFGSQVCIKNDEFCIQMMKFAFKMMNFELTMMNFVLKMMKFVTGAPLHFLSGVH